VTSTPHSAHARIIARRCGVRFIDRGSEIKISSEHHDREWQHARARAPETSAEEVSETSAGGNASVATSGLGTERDKVLGRVVNRRSVVETAPRINREPGVCRRARAPRPASRASVGVISRRESWRSSGRPRRESWRSSGRLRRESWRSSGRLRRESWRSSGRPDGTAGDRLFVPGSLEESWREGYRPR
jgi:hypothetical protein